MSKTEQKNVKPIRAWGLLNIRTNKVCAFVWPTKDLPRKVDQTGKEFKVVRVEVSMVKK